jgi:hypothetical protein
MLLLLSQATNMLLALASDNAGGWVYPSHAQELLPKGKAGNPGLDDAPLDCRSAACLGPGFFGDRVDQHL